MVEIMHKPKETKKSANLSLDQSLLREAKELGISLSGAAEDGLRSAIAREKSERWKRENASAIASSNKWVEENGLPLSEYRQF